MSIDLSRVRNIGICAHIDAGKTTVTERILFYTGMNYKLGEVHEGTAPMDFLEEEQERGITIRSAATTCPWTFNDNEYKVNLIDTPGHVDFSYEVSRSLQACAGALLVVDASQGVEAQTIANVFLALDQDLELLPVLNKIDLPGADVDACAAEVEAIIGLDCTDAIPASAKAGIGIEDILEQIVERVPPPLDTSDKPLRALVFDSYYDAYRGVVVFLRVVDGEIRKGDKVRFSYSGTEYEALEVGVPIARHPKVKTLSVVVPPCRCSPHSTTASRAPSARARSRARCGACEGASGRAARWG